MCWRKLISAADFYDVDRVILGGDMTGKAVVPIVRQNDGTCTSSFLGRKTILASPMEIEAHKKLIVDAGRYIFECDPEDLEKLKDNKDEADEIFKEKVIERIRDWLRLAEINLKPKHKQIIVAPGNDDQEYIDQVLRESEVILMAEGRVLDIDGHEMLSSGWSNPTPWHTPRECSEEELRNKIETMTPHIKNFETSIFNIHVPPFGSGLDVAPKLKENMEVDPKESSSVGSTAVLELIKKHQPMIGLHGHIHESRGRRQIGRTVCVNPGSNYTDSILSGVVVTLGDKKIESVVFTSG